MSYHSSTIRRQPHEAFPCVKVLIALLLDEPFDNRMREEIHFYCDAGTRSQI